MNILICNSLYWPQRLGGAELSVKTLAEGLTDRGHEVSVLSVGVNNKEYEKNGVRVFQLHHNNKFWVNDGKTHAKHEKFLWRLKDMYNRSQKKLAAEILDRIKPNIVNTNVISGLSVSVWDAAGEKKLPVIHTLRDYYLMCRRSQMYSPAKGSLKRQDMVSRLYTANKKYMSQIVRHVVGVSRYILDKHIDAGYFRQSGKSVIYNPAPDLKPSGYTGKIKYAYVGRLVKSKGIEELLELFQERPEELYVCGKGEESYTACLKRRWEAPNIRFMGYVDKREIYSKYCDVLFMPLIWDEPYGGIFLDARASGKYVITTRSGGTMEALKGYDKAVFLEDVMKEGNALMNRIEKNPEMVMRRSDSRLVNLNSTDEYISQYEKIFQGALQ